MRNCYGTTHIRTKGRETLQRSQHFGWKSGNVEEEKEFANLNEGEERKAEPGQDEGKTKTQKNRMEGRPEAKAGGDTKGREMGAGPRFHSLSIHTATAGRCKATGTGGEQSVPRQGLVPEDNTPLQLGSRGGRPCTENWRAPTANEP